MDTNVSTYRDHALDDGEADQPSAEWWRRRSPEEIRDLINRGFAGGELFAAATAEMARRSGEARRAAEQEAMALAEAGRRRMWKRRILFVLLSLSLIATFVTIAVIATQIGTD